MLPSRDLEGAVTISPTAPVVAYDILNAGPIDTTLLPMLILPALGLVMIIFPNFMRRLPKSVDRVFSWFYFLFSGSISALWLLSSFTSYSSLRDARVSGAYQTVEGCLEAFHPMPESGHDDERLIVGGRTFTYSNYGVTSGFRNAESHGGPIHRDSWVRIAHVDNDIIKLEVADHACPAATADVPRQD